uniref:Thymidylate kinase n=3 Tax=Agrobacterium tumefaciens complex TaxID=1183400 RepID=A0A2Z2PUU0_9HYPH|nr:hypothetical protein [Agrobacterium radiobacter]ASK46428.1 hypothetical protein [Agrobacterium fabrum]QEG98043.1 hypothetical protein AgrTiT37_00080 [Agrobacterium tumefaciens]BAA87682.1 tiorf57 [Agrobacterium tumefaciens]
MTIGHPIYISGPHGTGKTTLHRQLIGQTDMLNLRRGFREILANEPYVRVFLSASLHCNDLLAHRLLCSERSGLGDRCIIDSIAYLQAFRTLDWISSTAYETLKSTIFGAMSLVRWPRHVIVLNPTVAVAVSNVRERGLAKGWRQDSLELSEALFESYDFISTGGLDINTKDWLVVRDVRDPGLISGCVAFLQRASFQREDGFE